MAIPTGFTTQLAAVNVLLQSVSESPVTSVDTSLSVDVAAAVQVLAEVLLAVQTKGWSWNRDEGVTLARDGSNNINLPADALWVGNSYWQASNTPVNVVERGRKLYDKDHNTFVFTDDVVVDLVHNLIWDDVPEYVRQAVQNGALRLFQARLQGNPGVDRVALEAVQQATALIEQREDETNEQNSIGGNRYTSDILYGGPRRRR